MELWQRICATGAAVSLLAVSAAATTVTGRSSTMLEWYDTTDGETAMPVYQYLMLGARNIKDTDVDFRLYGRLSTDINDEVDADSRLYYAYAEKRGINDAIDLRVGRQFIFNPAGSSIMDGVNVDYDSGEMVTFSLFGGGDVKYYESYDAKDLMFGGKVGGKFSENDLKLGLAYMEKMEDGDTTHQLIGFSGDYSYHNIARFYGEYQLDAINEVASHILVGLHYFEKSRWQVRAEYLYSKPVFSDTSFYGTLPSDEYQEVLAQLNYRVRPGLHAFGRLTHEMYESSEVNNANVIEAGLEQIRVNRFAGYVSCVVRQHEDDDELLGVRARASYLLNSAYQVGGGASMDVLERRLNTYGDPYESEEVTSHRIYLDVTAFLSSSTSLEARIERIESDHWDDEYHYGSIRFNYHF
ncbi:hypothetical protein LGV61_12375 [Desulfurispirillum indicum]|uniref:hypothetical protein n=1 Tax=Desulfurispirillum indicum TaxID=936456 RepID=UPI001CFBD0AC|nr:hypothetical protein [Desulfurispirillum indicum]UCZ56508.1 hypothetical protein LGV61_12375 [Desulfurispirillum indicum]